MKLLAPEILGDMANIRVVFPGATMTYFKAGDLELGKAPVEGCELPDSIRAKVEKAQRKAAGDVMAERLADVEKKRIRSAYNKVRKVK